MDINELKDMVLSTLNQATSKVGGAANRAVGTAKSGGRLAKLAMEASAAREDVKRTYLEIGKLYYDTHKDNPEGFFVQLFEEVRLAEEDIAAREAELSALRESFKSVGKASEDAEDPGEEFERVVNAGEEGAASDADAPISGEVMNDIRDARDTVMEKVQSIKDTVVEKAGAVKDTVAEKFGSAAEAVSAKVSEMRGYAEEKAGEAAEAFGQAAEAVEEAVDSAAEAADEAAEDRESE